MVGNLVFFLIPNGFVKFHWDHNATAREASRGKTSVVHQ